MSFEFRQCSAIHIIKNLNLQTPSPSTRAQEDLTCARRRATGPAPRHLTPNARARPPPLGSGGSALRAAPPDWSRTDESPASHELRCPVRVRPQKPFGGYGGGGRKPKAVLNEVKDQVWSLDLWGLFIG